MRLLAPMHGKLRDIPYVLPRLYGLEKAILRLTKIINLNVEKNITKLFIIIWKTIMMKLNKNVKFVKSIL